MANVDTASFISVSEANQLGVSGLIKEAERGHDKVVLRNNKPVAVVVGFERFEDYQRQNEDFEDLALTVARMAASTDRRTSLDEILDRFGCTREELRALTEE